MKKDNLELFTKNGDKVTMIVLTLPNNLLKFLCDKPSDCMDGFVGTITTTVSTKLTTKNTVKGEMCFCVSLENMSEDKKSRWSYLG